MEKCYYTENYGTLIYKEKTMVLQNNYETIHSQLQLTVAKPS